MKNIEVERPYDGLPVRRDPRSPDWKSVVQSMCLVMLLCGATITSAAEPRDAAARTAHFDDTIRPLLREYCVTCHSTEKQEGELDLQRFTSLEQVKQHPDVW
jgi:hypothetical protein